MNASSASTISFTGLTFLAILVGSCQKGPDQAPASKVASDLVLPGAEPYSQSLASRLRAAVAERGSSYEPRTKHRALDGGPKYINRLIFESSPYLQQHAHNPVNWYSWGDEAFATAKRLGRMILLSVGYSTCHWCHVMEEESFEDPNIARYLNANYVAVKVDREELPDVDSIYMAAVTRSIGRGGWPMTVWLTPDLQPIHGETYLPPRTGTRGQRIGFLEILQRFKVEYDEDPATVVARGEKMAAEIAQMKTAPRAGTFGKTRASRVLLDVAERYKSTFDPVYGGRRGRPKFPSSFPVRLLLRLHRRTGDSELLNMASVTLEKMAAGGIYDQVGGGFHRYSVDERWLVPHFEKMLYDNGLLAVAYLEGYQATGKADFGDIAREILRYVSREMTAPGGAFYSATDADNMTRGGHREEGEFFVWTPKQLTDILDPDSYALVKNLYGVTTRGNFEGKNILYLARTLDEVRREQEIPPDEAKKRLETIRDTLYQARLRRIAPERDDKILVSWNGLMISAFAQAARVFDAEAPHRSQYLMRARSAADFILKEMANGDGLWRTYMDGKMHVPAYLDDYAFFINGLLDIFEAGGGTHYLERAIALDKVVHDRFEDTAEGGFFLSSNEHGALLAREKPMRDGAIPSGNSSAVNYLLRLYEMTTKAEYISRAEATLNSLTAVLTRSPSSLSELLVGVDFWTDTAKEIVIVTRGNHEQASAFTQVLGETFLPNAVVSIVSAGETDGELGDLMPIVRQKIAQQGETTAYVCEQQRCELPTRDPAVFAKQIAKVATLARTRSP